MTPPTAHLLTIPRELRDQIYSYLTHSFQRTWISQDQRFSCVIRYENAPLPSLFLAHTRLRDEYLEAVRNKPPSATFIADSPRNILASLLENNDFKYRGLELLYNATLVVDYRPPYEADFSLQLIPCIVVLGARASRLRTIQVALARRLATMSHKQLPMVRHIMNHVHTGKRHTFTIDPEDRSLPYSVQRSGPHEGIRGQSSPSQAPGIFHLHKRRW
jgi:hypothetical protein